MTCLSLDGNWSRLYSGSADRTVRVWDVANRKLLRTFPGHSDDVTAVVHFEPVRVASAGRYVLISNEYVQCVCMGVVWDVAKNE